MNYIGRKDGGTYIPSQGNTVDFDSDLLVEIAYVPEIADLAAKKKVKYRDLFIKLHKDGKSKTTEQG